MGDTGDGPREHVKEQLESNTGAIREQYRSNGGLCVYLAFALHLLKKGLRYRRRNPAERSGQSTGNW